MQLRAPRPNGTHAMSARTPNTFELVSPAEVIGGQRKQLPQRGRVADHRHPQRPGTEPAHRPVARGELIEHGLRIGQEAPNQTWLVVGAQSVAGAQVLVNPDSH